MQDAEYDLTFEQLTTASLAKLHAYNITYLQQCRDILTALAELRKDVEFLAESVAPAGDSEYEPHTSDEELTDEEEYPLYDSPPTPGARPASS